MPEISTKSDASNILISLRKRTRNVHQRLHQHPLTRNLVRKCLSLEQYVTALYALDRYHEMIDQELEKYPQFVVKRNAASLIKRDYLALTGDAFNPFPPCPALQLETSPDVGLGLIYVIEGSRQGGSIIARNLANTLALDCEYGASFFNQGNSSLKTDWHTLVRALSEQCDNTQRCCESAISTFERLESYLWSAHQTLPIKINLEEPA